MKCSDLFLFLAQQQDLSSLTGGLTQPGSKSVES